MRFLTLTLATMACLATSSGYAQDILDAARKVAADALQPGQSAQSLPGISQTQASGALKAALGKAVDSVVNRLGTQGGFLNDPLVRIGLPGALKDVAPILQATGKAGLLTDLESRMNRGAELATPAARKLFHAAVDKMSWGDAISIVTGGKDAATQYLRRTSGLELENQMRPIVGKQLQGAGAIKAFDSVVSKVGGQKNVGAIAGALGGVLGGNAGQSAQNLGTLNVTDYVTNKAVDGIFTYVAKEEAVIRANPLAAGSKLISTVFGAIR
jgi:Protein of unknown function (DUF4197)